MYYVKKHIACKLCVADALHFSVIAGVIVCGETVAQCFDDLYYLERVSFHTPFLLLNHAHQCMN